jgi:hypothetical protein
VVAAKDFSYVPRSSKWALVPPDVLISSRPTQSRQGQLQIWTQGKKTATRKTLAYFFGFAQISLAFRFFF